MSNTLIMQYYPINNSTNTKSIHSLYTNLKNRGAYRYNYILYTDNNSHFYNAQL